MVFLTVLKAMVTNLQLYGYLELPTYIRRDSNVNQLCDHLYPHSLLNDGVNSHGALIGRAILAFRNDTANDFNDFLVVRIPGQEYRFDAANYVVVPDDSAGAEPFAVEYLQSIGLASIQPSSLRLEMAAPIMLLRNLSPREGLCNGIRMRVLGIRRTCLQDAIMGGRSNGKICLLPRIKLTTTEEDLLFILQGAQFPVQLCFSIRVNKFQG